jgi:hypothetical protein
VYTPKTSLLLVEAKLLKIFTTVYASRQIDRSALDRRTQGF